MKNDLFNLSDRVVIITGGIGLLGLEYARALAKQGARAVLIDIAAPEAADRLLRKKIPESGPRSRVFYFKCDIIDRQALQQLRQKIIAKFGRVNVLINNAALNPKVEGAAKSSSTHSKFENFPTADWEREMRINVTGAMLCCQIFGSAMSRGGSIINIASIYGLVAPDQRLYRRGFIKPATYGVSKGALIALTKYLASYWGRQGIRVNCLVPGGVFNGQDPAFVKRYAARVPLGRMAKPNEYNGIIIYLASDASSYSTGATFVVDGGWTAW